MLRNDRDNRSEAVILAGFSALAIFGAIVLVYALGLLNGRESERRQQTPASYSQAAQSDAQRACAGRQSTTLFECVYERVKASQEQARGEQDLSAQQRAATSALASAVVALLTLIVTGIGVWFVKRTLEATVKAVEDTSLATVAMGEANEIAREALAVQNRAWIKVDVAIIGKLEITGDQPEVRASIDLTFTNVGGTPAINVSCVTELQCGLGFQTGAAQKAISDRLRETPERGWFPNATIFPNQFARQTHNIGTGHEALANMRAQFAEWGPLGAIVGLAVVGSVQYRLPGSRTLHQTGFAHNIELIPTPDRGQAIFETDFPIEANRLQLRLPIEGAGLID